MVAPRERTRTMYITHAALLIAPRKFIREFKVTIALPRCLTACHPHHPPPSPGFITHKRALLIGWVDELIGNKSPMQMKPIFDVDSVTPRLRHGMYCCACYMFPHLLLCLLVLFFVFFPSTIHRTSQFSQ
ncbi:uncharacterized protein BO80DRAFT_290380 [Aspergillus ibericus CBS 121593]|uniref:Uncharacterized protein n=1 Tax=Aspergillus ibericus CBS 121593 TaxID=1448316 RepID=A0A395GJM8_9EURO|nr:hypothetical protein BO80DRAFT_290380 [Aspergillus ibericus CBS 121593]RAK94967.1 hypothetical protein BO80DRAFT_290380 [Aspergillus ibericus CBS 121593]